jgi:general secretion pathway protein M
MKVKADRATIVVGMSLGFVLLVVLYWLLHFWFLHQDFAAEIEAIEPKTARLLGIMQSVDQLGVASSEASARLRELAYGADRDSATTAAAMQQSIRELMTGAGLSISGSQILPQRKSEAFDRLSLDITAQGNIEALDAVLSGLETMRPLVFIEALKVNPERSRGRGRGQQAEVAGDPRNLTARFQLFSLRLKD